MSASAKALRMASTSASSSTKEPAFRSRLMAPACSSRKRGQSDSLRPFVISSRARVVIAPPVTTLLRGANVFFSSSYSSRGSLPGGGKSSREASTSAPVSQS
jgi:hypothetical protein